MRPIAPESTGPGPEHRWGHAGEVVSAAKYLVLATSTLGGTPWITPVYFAVEDPCTFWWVSHPGTRHSRNIAANPQVALVAFDSTVRPGEAAAVYCEAWAEQCADADVERGLQVYSARSARHGATGFDAAMVTGDARLRLYRARASTLDVLSRDGGPDRRLPAWRAGWPTYADHPLMGLDDHPGPPQQAPIPITFEEPS